MSVGAYRRRKWRRKGRQGQMIMKLDSTLLEVLVRFPEVILSVLGRYVHPDICPGDAVRWVGGLQEGEEGDEADYTCYHGPVVNHH